MYPSILRLWFAIPTLGAALSFSPAALRAQPADADLVETIRHALESPALDRQKAILTLIPEAGLKGKAALATANHLAAYLKKTKNEECTILALNAYGKLAPPAPAAALMLKAFQTGQTPAVRRAAGSALVGAATGACAEFSRPDNSSVGKPSIMMIAEVESIGSVAGAAPAVLAVRGWTTVLLNEEASYIRFGENSKQLLPLCATALNDDDDVVRAFGAHGIHAISSAIGDNLPDPSASGSETKTVDPFEAKLKWLLLQPAFKALNEAAPSLRHGIQSRRVETRLASVRAAESTVQTRGLALASRRSLPDNLQSFVANPPPEDPLRTSAVELLPAVAAALHDPSPAIRLTAAEAFENLGDAGRSQLPALIQAARNDDLFVRWAATRALGRMLLETSGADNERIVAALTARVTDDDLDVVTAALTALGKGKLASRPATDVVLRRTAQGDPDTCILAVHTLDSIGADRATAVAGLIPVLNADSIRVRKAVVIYLGKAGTAARPAIPALRKLLFDADEEVRKETAKAILSIEKEL